VGQRANLLVGRRGTWTLYYDHWCANRLDVELFWGLDLALTFIEQRDAKDSSYWLDEVWCEGAAAVDTDRHLLLFFGGEDILWDIPLRRAHLALMREAWPGWEVRWADEGIVTVGSYAGEPRKRFLDDHQPGPKARFSVLTEYPEDNTTLLTCTTEGATTVRRVYGDEESLRLGPGQLAVLSELEGSDSLDWEGEMPSGGCHIDLDRKSIAFWWAETTPAIEDRARSAWPGWQVTWLRDRYEDHVALSGLGIRLPERPLADLQTERLDQLRLLCDHEAKNPAKELAARAGATEINPATDEARGSVGTESEKLEHMDRLASRVPIR